MMFVRPGGDGRLHSPSTLILPALSIGNAGQLAVDLLISSLALSKAGYLDEPHVLPCVGNDPFGPTAEGKLTVSLEVYEDAEQGLSIVQQRAPVVKGTMMKYASNVADWAVAEGVKEVIILSGLDAGKRKQMDLPPIQYISTANTDGSDVRCERLGWRRLEGYSSIDAVLTSEEATTDEMYYLQLPFSSLFSCCKARGLKVVCVLCFCAEGDNVPDAFVMADGLQRLLHPANRAGNEWKIPLSWTTVYGPPPDDSMFC